MGGGEHTVNKIRVSIAFHRAGGGGSNLPRLCRKFYACRASGVTRLNSGGDCLPSLSLS